MARTWRLAYYFLLILACGELRSYAQEVIARVVDFSGELQIQRGKDVIVPAREGPRIKHNAVYDDDTVRTGKGAADLLLDDGSRISMDESTTLKISVLERATPAKGVPPVERRIRVLLGRVWSEIKPSKSVGTIFELPEAVAAVRGTTLRAVVAEAGKWEFYVDAGGADITQEALKARASLVKGCGLGCERAKSWDFTNLGTGDVAIYLPPSPYTTEGGPTEMRPTWIEDFNPGEKINIRQNPDGTFTITEVIGRVRTRRPRMGAGGPWGGIPFDEAIPPRKIGLGGGGGGMLPPPKPPEHPE